MIGVIHSEDFSMGNQIEKINTKERHTHLQECY